MKALLIAPNVGGFYQDIIDELQRRGFETDYIWDAFDKDDPDFIHSPYFGDNKEQKDRVLSKYKLYWADLLNRSEYNKKYDLLFVIDGKMLHPYLFDVLRQRNPSIKSINYLYDTTRGNYRFNVNSSYFDKVVTYDRKDSEDYEWGFMPIPWCKMEPSEKRSYVFFGMGNFIPSRFILYKLVNRIATEHNLESFIKLFVRRIKLYPIKYFVNFFLQQKQYVKPSIYYSRFIVHDFIPKDVFQQAMMESEVIVDSIDPRQDGLTARCTWALGAGKKIITNNQSIKMYDFYSPEQIFVVENASYSKEIADNILSFAKSTYVMPVEIRQKIDSFRIDNWMSQILL